MRLVFSYVSYIVSVILIIGLMGCSTAVTDNSASPVNIGLDRDAQEVTTSTSNYLTGCVDLLAGQTILAGQVCFDDIDNDNDGWDDTLVVNYTTTGGWELVETHFWIGTSIAQMPQTSKGNPIPGQFPYKSGDITGLTVYSFEIPFSVIGMTCPGDAKFFAVAAHATVRKPNGTGGYQTEAGWGNGPQIVPKGNWATWFTIKVTCDEPQNQEYEWVCETAFAKSITFSHCFKEYTCFDDNEDQGNVRWGWTNGPLGAGTYNFDIYAGAGQCDITKGVLVGTLTVDYDGSTALVTYQMDTDYYLYETHLYVGNEPLPKKCTGPPSNPTCKCTVAPGQLGGNHSPLDYVATDLYTIDNLSGNIYVIAHAVSCMLVPVIE